MSMQTQIHFCPRCSNILKFNTLPSGIGLSCFACPYSFELDSSVSISLNRYTYTAKSADILYGGKDAYKNVSTTEEICPKCSHNRAYYKQTQTRSADEPMTTQYKCVGCSHQWSEN